MPSYYTSIAVGAAANAATINSPLTQLDTALVNLHTQTDTVLNADGTLKAAVAGNGLAVAGGVLSVGVDGSTVEISADALRIKDLGVATAKLADGAVTAVKRDQNTLLKEWTLGNAFDINGTPTFDTTWPNVVSSVTVIWPDGTGGTYTATTINATWGTVDAYTVTYTGAVTKTVTQAAVTRDSQGRVTTRPVLVIT